MSAATDTAEAVRIIEEALGYEGFDSRLGTYLQETFWSSTSRDTFYSRIRDEEGQKAAEAALEQFIEVQHLREVAFNLTDIVEGVLAVLRTEHRNLTVSCGPVSESKIMSHLNVGPQAKLITLINPEVPGCGCVQQAGSAIFGHYGKLKLTAITLLIDPRQPNSNKVTLALPRRNSSMPGCVLVELARDGYMHVCSYSYDVRPLDAAYFTLGVNKNLANAHIVGGGDEDNLIGFPDAGSYVASQLPNLGGYLKDAAQKLSGTHTH